MSSFIVLFFGGILLFQDTELTAASIGDAKDYTENFLNRVLKVATSEALSQPPELDSTTLGKPRQLAAPGGHIPKILLLRTNRLHRAYKSPIILRGRQFVANGEAASATVLDPEKLAVAEQLNGVVVENRNEGNYDETLKLNGQALDLKTDMFFPDHSELDDAKTLNSRAMSMVTDGQGSYDDALELHGKALAIQEKTLGADHPDVAATLDRMAKVKDSQGSIDEALELYSKALAIREKALGPVHPEIAHTLNDMGMLNFNQSNYDEALKFFGKAVPIMEKEWGPAHPDVAAMLNKMASVNYRQGSYDEALELYNKALAISEDAHGHVHPDVASSLSKIAATKYMQDNYSDALELYAKALSIKEKLLGPEHLDLVGTLNNMALLKDELDRYDEAIELYNKADAIGKMAAAGRGRSAIFGALGTFSFGGPTNTKSFDAKVKAKTIRELKRLKMPELKAMLRKQGLKTTGKKLELIERLYTSR